MNTKPSDERERVGWEPSYGFTGSNLTEVLALARTLEAVRRQVCCYGGGNRCDCKYGLSVRDTREDAEFGMRDKDIVGSRYDFETKQQVEASAGPGSEQTGCPELRELINRLLHRAESLSGGTVNYRAAINKGYDLALNHVQSSLDTLKNPNNFVRTL